MRKVFTIAQREYTSRVLTRIFWVSVLLVPIGMLLLIVIPILANNSISKEKVTVKVCDESNLIFTELDSLTDTFVSYEKIDIPFSELMQEQGKLSFPLGENGILLAFDPSTIEKDTIIPLLFYEGKPSLSTLGAIEKNLNQAITMSRLKKAGIKENPLSFKVHSVQSQVDESGKVVAGNAEIAALLGYGMAFLNYMMVFIYGVMLMRGVVEEKTSRIVEVILSSVKPIQLMAGKLIGICAVGLTQFLLWIILVFATTSIAGAVLATSSTETATLAAQSGGMNAGSIFFTVMGLLSPKLLFCFIFYFLGGFLLFGSLFAAIGSAVDQEQDTQQLMWPVTIPLIIPMLLIGNVLMNPNGGLAVFLSIFPFSSPTIMMIRLSAAEVPLYQVLLSMFLLVLGIFFCIWMAARIYRTGILMYGKKPTLRELGKWILRS